MPLAETAMPAKPAKVDTDSILADSIDLESYVLPGIPVRTRLVPARGREVS